MADHQVADNAIVSDEKATERRYESPAPYESPTPRDPTPLEYAKTRFSTLKPPMNSAPNPIRLLGTLTGKQWLFFSVGFIAW